MKIFSKITKLAVSSLLCVSIVTGSLTSCSLGDKLKGKDDGKLDIVTTIFPSYDFAKEISGDNANITMLLKSGQESHTYEPTTQDILSIQNCDLFIYVGGENDAWVDDILESFDEPVTVIKMMDCVQLCEEVHIEGTDDHDHEHDHDHETDEHVWTSPKNAMAISQEICDTLCEIDEDNKDEYKKNCENYLSELQKLDGEIREVVESAKRDTLVFGDRFPFLYFAQEYGLNYYAAFSGCSTETEPSAKTIAFLIEKIESEDIPAVLYIEFSAQTVADSIAEQTGTKSLLLHSCHNVTKEEIEDGASYISLMEGNIEVLKEALN